MAEWRKEVVPLQYPIEDGGVTYKEIVLLEPDADAVEAIEDAGFIEGVKPTTRQLKQSVAALSKWPLERVGKLHRNDLMNVTEKSVPLLQGSSDSSPPGSSGEATSTTSAATSPTG